MLVRWAIFISLTFSMRAGEPGDVSRANQTLQLAGYPALPAKAEKLDCQSWSGRSAGIYATFVLKDPDALSAYLSSLPAGLGKASPIPPNLLSPSLSEAPWFTPPNTPKAYVLYRGRIWHAAPETFRLYVDPDKTALYLYYTWNNKHTYP